VVRLVTAESRPVNRKGPTLRVTIRPASAVLVIAWQFCEYVVRGAPSRACVVARDPYSRNQDRQVKTLDSLTEQLRDLEERLARREVQSREELRGLLADGFREHGASGRAYSRADVLANYELGCATEVELANFAVVMIGPDAALATYHSREADGRESHRVSVWVRNDGGWQMLFHQGTMAPENQEPLAGEQ
jgi:hypothetical protein